MTIQRSDRGDWTAGPLEGHDTTPHSRTGSKMGTFAANGTPQTYPHVSDASVLETVFHEALRVVARKDPPPHVDARFYPYAGLSSTIRLRQGRILARVSDILRVSPPRVLYALACILVAKLYRKAGPADCERAYREYTTSAEVLEAIDEVRRRRGYKRTTSPRGRFYDLDLLFDQLNARYFEGSLAKPRLSWSERKTRRILGHHDHVHGAIVVSKSLDSEQIPRLVVDYVLYHEMLHVRHPARVVGGRKIYHGKQFREDERCFEGFEDALMWLEANATGPGRRTTKRTRRTR